MAQPLPQVLDPRLRLELVAEEPRITTPIGLAIDHADRLFVLESHTHDRPAGYDGPEADRVKVFSDQDQDGTLENVQIFADGIQNGLNLAFSPDGVLYVVCAREVYALPDADDDGRCDRLQRIATLDTEERYSHNCLLGIAFDRHGQLYISRGNTGSRGYTFVGSDGSKVSGYGDGGSILFCQSDGSQVGEFATGLWNPFSIKFDRAGRLLCVDNDPDARGPNRLVQIVRGGDYGYRSLFGAAGNHPFQGWNGDLPGTLPYISGTGEAPCDLIDCRRTSLPEEFSDSVLVTVWNENTIERHDMSAERHDMSAESATMMAEASVLVVGGDEFRPVAIDADRQGNIFFTDWVLVSYPTHGRGRIWKLSAQQGQPSMQPRARFDLPEANPGNNKLNSLAEANAERDWLAIRKGLTSGDPFLHHSAVMALARTGSEPTFDRLSTDADARIRLGCLLAARRSEFDRSFAVKLARHFLADTNDQVRRAAMIWIGTESMTELRSHLDMVLQDSDVTPLLFETYLAAVECLDTGFVRALRNRSTSKSSHLPRKPATDVLEQIVANGSLPPDVRALAVLRMADVDKPPRRRLLLGLLGESDSALQLAVLRRLRGAQSHEVLKTLNGIALDPSQNESLRTASLSSLAHHSNCDPLAITPLLDDPASEVAVEAARTLRSCERKPEVLQAVRNKLATIASRPAQRRLAEQLRFLLDQDSGDRPTTLSQWQHALATGGDPDSGRRVFYSQQATCASCHTTNGLGGVLGPDLSNVAQSIDRQQIIHSILCPSDQFPPQYQAWVVTTTDGKIYPGLQLDHRPGGAIKLLTTDGKTRHFDAEDIDDYEASSQSIMPAGLETNLAVGEFLDLVAFLESLR